MVLQHTGSAMASMWKHSLGTSSHPLQTKSLPDIFFLLFATYLFSSTSTSSRLLCLQSHPPSLLVGGPGAEKGIYRVRPCRRKSNYCGFNTSSFTKYFTNISTGMTEVTRTLQTSKDNGQVVCSYYKIPGSVRCHRTFSLETKEWLITSKVFPLYPQLSNNTWKDPLKITSELFQNVVSLTTLGSIYIKKERESSPFSGLFHCALYFSQTSVANGTPTQHTSRRSDGRAHLSPSPSSFVIISGAAEPQRSADCVRLFCTENVFPWSPPRGFAADFAVPDDAAVPLAEGRLQL